MNHSSILGKDEEAEFIVIGVGADPEMSVFCEMCKKTIMAKDATLASTYADGRPAFACESHRIAFNEWAIFWTSFYTQQLGSVNDA